MDVRAWLEDHGLGQYAEVFASNDIDAEVLRTLTADDLKELGVASLGHRKKLLAAIAGLWTRTTAGADACAAPPGAYTPRHLAERILRSRAALEGERKQVTVLFADVKGSLALIEHADPEDARRHPGCGARRDDGWRPPLRGHGQPGPGRRHHGAVRRADRA